MAVKFTIYLIALQAINTLASGQFGTKKQFQVPFYPFQAAVRAEGAA